MKAATETGLLKAIKQYLELQGALVVRVNSGAFAGTHAGKKRFVRLNSEPGCSDLLACHRGCFLALEVKLPGRKLTAGQVSFLAQVEVAGGIAGVVRDLADVEQLLARVPRC
jgi:hypothetical protein